MNDLIASFHDSYLRKSAEFPSFPGKFPEFRHKEMEFDGSWSREDVVTTEVDPRTWGVETKKYIRVLENILTKRECDQLIDISERKGYETALVNIGGGRQRLMADVRNNDRCIIDDWQIMETCWQRVLSVCQDEELIHGPYRQGQSEEIVGLNGRMRSVKYNNQSLHAVGLNERMRILRYDPGTYFSPHHDGSYRRSREAGPDRVGEVSCITAQFYLNEGFQGGTTRFLNDWNESEFYDVVPKIGSLLLFQHDLYHEGALLIEGRKYALRTDVMYTTKGPGHEYAVEPLHFS